jgi:hypothetical protein
MEGGGYVIKFNKNLIIRNFEKILKKLKLLNIFSQFRLFLNNSNKNIKIIKLVIK